MTELFGIRCRLPDRCKCGEVEIVLVKPTGPHRAGMKCACGAHRGWLAAEAERFISKTIKQFGVIEGPIEIRRTDPMTQSLKRVIFSKVHRARTQGEARKMLAELKEPLALLAEPYRVVTLETVETIISKKPK